MKEHLVVLWDNARFPGSPSGSSPDLSTSPAALFTHSPILSFLRDPQKYRQTIRVSLGRYALEDSCFTIVRSRQTSVPSMALGDAAVVHEMEARPAMQSLRDSA
jgi:hypothetical protein